MKGYKALNKNWTCKGYKYEVGKTYELEDGEKLEICQCGFHFCKNPVDVFGYYADAPDTIIAEVEALGEIQQEGTKYCTNKIKIVREFSREEMEALYKDAQHNSGNYNSGDYNSGNFNSGNCNSGRCNSGRCNSGSYNSGDFNSGGFNSGDFNSGNFNSGRFNSGDFNSGRFNSGNYNSGFFNSNTPTVRLFNKDSGLTYKEFFGLCINFSNLETCLDKIVALPGFDAEIFKECTGIDVSDRREVEE